jgi:hypothetical protein
VRHGQAVSNYLSDTLGPDEWYGVEGTCEYTDKDKKHWDIFDAGGGVGGWVGGFLDPWSVLRGAAAAGRAETGAARGRPLPSRHSPPPHPPSRHPHPPTQT